MRGSIICIFTNIIRMIKLWRMRLEGHVACMGENREAYRILVGEPERKIRHRWEDNVEMELKDVGCRVWTEFIWLKIGTNGSFCEHGNKPLGTKQFLEHPSNYQLHEIKSVCSSL